MKATDDTGRNFEGSPPEEATLTIEEENTNFMVNYTLDGDVKTLQKGESLNIPFKTDGTATNLQFNFRFSGSSSDGSYKVTVKTVDDFPNGRSRTYGQQGSIPVVIDYSLVPV